MHRRAPVQGKPLQAKVYTFEKDLAALKEACVKAGGDSGRMVGGALPSARRAQPAWLPAWVAHGPPELFRRLPPVACASAQWQVTCAVLAVLHPCA